MGKHKVYSLVRFMGHFLLGAVIGLISVNYVSGGAEGVHKPGTFGITHFIVGQRVQQCAAQQSQRNIVSVPSTEWGVFFSPDDDVRTELLNFIKNEQEYIKIAVFVFTDMQIARALADAKERGVMVEVVTDSVGLRDRYSRIRDLCDAGIPVFIYDVQHGKVGLSSVMHHKFVVFGKNKDSQSYVWTGSCNFTRSACESNQENAVVLNGSVYSQRFYRQFEQLKKRSCQWNKKDMPI